MFNFISGNLRFPAASLYPSLNWGDLDVFLYQPHEREGFGSGISPPAHNALNYASSLLNRHYAPGPTGIRFADSDDLIEAKGSLN